MILFYATWDLFLYYIFSIFFFKTSQFTLIKNITSAFSLLHHIYIRTTLISPALFLWYIVISEAFFILINYRMLGVISLGLVTY